jgi:hypothetical protein
MSVTTVLLVVALVCFLIGAFNPPWRINLISLGLFFWVLSILIGSPHTLHLGR